MSPTHQYLDDNSYVKFHLVKILIIYFDQKYIFQDLSTIFHSREDLIYVIDTQTTTLVCVLTVLTKLDIILNRLNSILAV